MSRRAAKIDDNQKGIVRALREMGFSVALDHDDILVGHKGVTYWFEVKNPARCLDKHGALRESALKPSQKKLLAEWDGHYCIVWSVEMCLHEMGILPV